MERSKGAYAYSGLNLLYCDSKVTLSSVLTKSLPIASCSDSLKKNVYPPTETSHISLVIANRPLSTPPRDVYATLSYSLHVERSGVQ